MTFKNLIPTLIIPLSLFFILSGSSVWGMEWIELSTTQDGNVVSYDKASVKKIQTDIYRLWERFEFSKENVKNNIKSSVIQRELDCRECKTRITAVMDYDVNSNVLHSEKDNQSEWRSIPPNSRIETLYKIICE